MGILGRIFGLFRKREYELAEEDSDIESKDLGINRETDSTGMPRMRAMATDFPQESMDSNTMIMTKLDLLSIKLDNLDRRLQYIEKVARESEK